MGAVNNAATEGAGAGSTVAGSGAAAGGSNGTAIGSNANASADNTVAMGAGSAATGSGSAAVGSGAQASHDNSVALGQGSVTDRDNSVSVGSATQQRQITNVAAGTADTDAVNVGQLTSSVAQGVSQANSYTDQRFNAMNQQIDDVAKKSYSGSAAAVAIANLPQAPAPGKSIASAGGGTYLGQSACRPSRATASGSSRLRPRPLRPARFRPAWVPGLFSNRGCIEGTGLAGCESIPFFFAHGLLQPASGFARRYRYAVRRRLRAMAGDCKDRQSSHRYAAPRQQRHHAPLNRPRAVLAGRPRATNPSFAVASCSG